MENVTETTLSPSDPHTKAELLERIEPSWAAFQQLIGRLNERELTASTGDDGWSVKDYIVHLTVWEQSVVNLLRSEPRHLGLGVDEETYLTVDEDGLNAIIYERNKDRPLADVLSAFHKTHQDFLATLEPLSDAELLRTYSEYLPDEPGEDTGEPVILRLGGNTYAHYDSHLKWIEERIGRG